MKKIFFTSLLIFLTVVSELVGFCSSIASAQTRDYPIKPVNFTKVKLNDKFWSPRIETNRTVTIPASFARCENTGRVKNFQMAAIHTGKLCTKYPFDDTDIYKTIEGASYSLAVHHDAKLSKYIDSLITIIGRAQEPDGYLYTARTIDPLHPHEWSGTERWVKENELSHELYDSGHLFEAAAAHYQATGERNLLTIALKNADLLVKTFGFGKRHVAPGHEIVEMGLVRLYRISGKTEYLDLAKFFIDERGHRTYAKTSTDEWKNGMYWQDDRPVNDQDEAEGHAVRAMYLYSGMADVAALTGDKQYLAAIDRIWNNMVSKKIYVQGGIGAVGEGERFGADYELPNSTAYNETCAAIGSVFWNQRMFLLHGDAKYIDLLEKVLYNGLISGVSLDGQSFFYTNAMQVLTGSSPAGTEARRSGWFECSCCPTNIARFLPSLSGYVYAQKNNSVYVNLFIAGNASLVVGNKKVVIVQHTIYPYDGDLNFEITPEVAVPFTMLIRIPGWANAEAIPSDLYTFENKSAAKISLTINGKETNYKVEAGYARISRRWQKGDKICLILPMPVKEVVANKELSIDHDKVALQRGPLIYCAESTDNSCSIGSLQIPLNTLFTTAFKPDLLNGITILNAEIISKTDTGATQNIAFTAIPYYAWANRGKGEMTVWFPRAIAAVK